MKVTVKLFATLRDFLPDGCDGACELELPEGAAIGRALEEFDVPEEIRLIIFLNSKHADKDRVLQEGDVVSVFPPLAGG